MYVSGNYTMPWPARHMHPNGLLPATPAAAALWYFISSAHRMAAEIPEQVTVEGDEDVRVNLNDAIRSTAICYGVTKEVMMEDELVRRAIAEAERVKRVFDLRVGRFLATGGQVFAIYDREN